MKKNRIKLIATMILFRCIGNISANEFDADIRNAKDFSQEELVDLFTMKNSPYVLRLSKGETFPISIKCDSEFFILASAQDLFYQIEFERDLYVKGDGENGILFSLDTIHWKTFLELFTGSLQVGIGSDDNAADSFIYFGTDLKERLPSE